MEGNGAIFLSSSIMENMENHLGRMGPDTDTKCELEIDVAKANPGTRLPI